MHRRNFLTAAAIAGVAALSSRRGMADAMKRCTLLHVTDTHAQLETHPEYMPGASPPFRNMGGFARLKTAIEAQRASATGPCFLADGGDLVQGSGPAAWSEGMVMIGPANALGYDVFVPGNWEPVYGPRRFEELMGALTTKVIAYNFHYKDSGKRMFDAAVTVVKDGVRICFIGVADPTTTERQPPVQVRGLDSTRMAGFKDFIAELRAKERPDLVVVVSHTGLTVSRQLARETPGIDVILSGHTHERTYEPIFEGGCLIVEAGSHGSFLGRLDLVIKPEGGIERHAFKLIEVDEDSFEADSTVSAIVDKELAPYRDRMRQELCKTDVPILRYDVLETNADNLITDIVRDATGADIAVSNGFRFAPPVLPGRFTEADQWNLLPMDSRMKMGFVTGAQLRTYLEGELELVFSENPWKLSGGWGPRASGLEVTFTAHKPKGERVSAISVAGKPVESDARYSFAGCEREGEPLDVVCRHRGTLDVSYVGDSIHEAMHRYFEKHAVISPANTGRSKATDLPAHVFSQDKILTESAG